MNLKKVFENKKLVIGLIVLAIVAIGFGIYQLIPKHNVFVKTSDMTVKRMNHVATLLQDGRVLITGWNAKTAEIYDPKTAKFTRISDMVERRTKHTATLLQDGRVLIAGGYPSMTISQGLASAEIYDPKTNKFTKTGDMNFYRKSHTAILLNNGKVLIIGGHVQSKEPLPPNVKPINSPLIRYNAELYDPATGKFTLTPKHKGWYEYPTAAMLPDGRVIVVGDYKEKVAEIYDPKKNEFAQIDYEPVSTKVSNDKILFLGFRKGIYPRLYDVNMGKFIQSKSKLDSSCTTTVLNNNKVLMIGITVRDKDGLINDFNTLYDIKKDNFIKIKKLGDCFGGNIATLLNNGDVLITGGTRKDKINKRKRVILKEAVLYKY